FYPYFSFFFFQAEDGIRDFHVTGVQTCALPISASLAACSAALALCEPITFTAGRAACSSFIWANSSFRAPPVMTPGFSLILLIMFSRACCRTEDCPRRP